MEGEQNALLRVNEIAWRLLDRLEQAVKELDAVMMTHREKVKTENGEQVTEYELKMPRRKGTVDRGGLKQLTGVLKDLEEILESSPMDLRERELRLVRLEKELEQGTTDSGIRVTMEEEAERFAD